MPRLLRREKLLWLLAVFLFGSCKKEFSCESCGDNNGIGVNRPPVANTGADKTITLPAAEIYLDGTGSVDLDNNITSYAWVKISGPSNVIIADANAAQTTFTRFVQGIYEFELKVTDAEGLFSRDTVAITITANEETAHWQQLQNLPEKEFFFGSNHINFLIGIENKMFAASKNGSFWYYDPQTNEWLQKGDLPAYMASSNFSVVFSVNNIGYIIGNGTCRQYNATTGEWTTKNNAPVGIDHVDYSVPLVIGDKVYLVGSTNNLVTLYDPSTDTYTQKNKFPDVGAGAGFVINGEGYCVQQDGRCWKYNPASDAWQQKASLPSLVYFMSGLSLNGFGYIIGSSDDMPNDAGSRLNVWRYDPSTDQWKQSPEDYPGYGVYAVKTVALDGIAYVGLGYDTGDGDALDFWSFQ